MHDYQRKGYTQYGAWMGRGSDLPFDRASKLSIRKVPINSGGYDPGGAYWGTGEPLYCVSDVESGECRYLRATSRDAVKARFPNGRFFR